MLVWKDVFAHIKDGDSDVKCTFIMWMIIVDYLWRILWGYFVQTGKYNSISTCMKEHVQTFSVADLGFLKGGFWKFAE